MKYILLAIMTLLCTAVFADAIITNSGDFVEAPPGYKAVFVPIGTGDVLITLKTVDVITPEPDNCTPEGELTFGEPLCAD